MPNLFVFTAGNPEAQEHLEQSIKNPVASETVLDSFPAEEHPRLREIQAKASGFYAWGATPGPLNEDRWNRMEIGDWVLCVYDNVYRYVGQVLGKFRNSKCATATWGVDEDGQTWEYMYFLTKPVELNRPVAVFADELNQGYRGFTRIGDEKVERLIQTHGSLESFIDRRVLAPTVATSVYLLLRSNIGSEWRDEEGESYHYGTTVPNYTKITPGTEFLLDRKIEGGVRIIGRGRIGEVREEPGAATGEGRHFRAAFAEYRALKPPRVITPDIQERLRAEPGYNLQHSIRVLSKDLFEGLARPARAWLFQANPQMYDVRAAVRALSEDTWTVTGYKNEIGPGDRVYVWESGPTGGVVAVADVLDRPSVRPCPEASKPFIKDDTLKVDRLCVALAIRQVVDIPRNRLRQHPKLQKLSIFKFAQASNFPVTPEEAEVIEDMIGTPTEPHIVTAPPRPADADAFGALLATLQRAGLRFPVEVVSNYVLALQAKRFVILTGISGTGKTRLAMAVAAHFSGPDHHVVAAVRPDWTDNRGLLGYLSPITDRYVDTPILQLLLRAEVEMGAAAQEGRPPHPYFVILDEMNLARVEHYFSDFLSCLESEEPLELHSGDPEKVGIPRSLKVPTNVFFTGTVNID